MTANQALFSISTMCKALGVSRAGYYALLGREPSTRSRADAALTERIKAIHVHGGICHSLGGNALSFLKMHKRTNDRLWLGRAQKYVAQNVHIFAERRSAGRQTKLQYWTGGLGLAVSIVQVCQKRAGIFTLDYFR